MTYIRITLIVLLAWFIAAGCGTPFSTGNSANISILEVRIQQGFEEHWIFIEGSDGGHLQTFVESYSIQPESQIVRYLEINSNQDMVVVRRVPTNGNRNSQSCYISLQLDAGQDYILNLTAVNNQIQTSLQEEPQQYL